MEAKKSFTKKIHLTFDDGPTPGITDRVLTLLDEFDAKATFFCLGKNVLANQELFNAIIEKGHTVGNHSYSHLNGWKTKKKEYLEDVIKANEIIKSQFFRPPYGKISLSQWFSLRRRKYRIILWTRLSRDYDKTRSVEYILKRIKKASHAGAVIVFHDSEKSWPVLQKVLPEYLEYLKQNDFKCLAIV